ncbi:MAG: hypothetical protein ACRDND_22095, partial [Streptosporangiaceae bacterium]
MPAAASPAQPGARPQGPASPASGQRSSGQHSSGQHWSPRLWAILIVLCGALFLDALDVSMVGVALPDIRASL